MGNTTIEWTNKTWNTLAGCSRCSPGCDNCYALAMTRRLAGLAKKKQGQGQHLGRLRHYLDAVDAAGEWFGSAEFVPEAMEEPLRGTTPARIFVNSMADTFHPSVSRTYHAKLYAVMVQAHWHTYQILTKRPAEAIIVTFDWAPHPHIWLGFTSEDQHWFDQRWYTGCGFAQRGFTSFVSLEPLLGPIVLPAEFLRLGRRTQVIVGGETGPHPRPMKPEWVRTLRDQCVEADVPFFFKGWGGRKKKLAGRELDGRTWEEYPDG